MNSKTVLVRLVHVSLLGVLFVSTAMAQTEKPAEENQTMRTLLSEVATRAKLEFEIKEHKKQTERYKFLLTRARDREQQLSTELRASQSRLSELENRLDLLEREIENEIERLRSEGKRPN